MIDARSTRTALAVCAVLWTVLVARAIMNTKGPEDFVITVTPEEVQSFAKAKLAGLQSQSFANDIELCGIIFEDSEGDLGTTPILEGEQANCNIAYFDEPGMAPIASFHTHGSHDREYDSEVPSLDDLRNDFDSGMDGFVSTPGGRLWRIDSSARLARQVCGERCLPQDPDYRPCHSNQPASQYSASELQARFEDRNRDC